MIAYTIARYPKIGLRANTRKQLRRHAHAGQDRDVDFRVSEEPEQVLPQQRRAALVILNLVVDHQAGRR